MNIEKLHSLIKIYKDNIEEFTAKEIYKWKAIKYFQDNWDIEARDFYEMWMNATYMTENLLTSSQSYPRKMIGIYAQHFPERTRNLFKSLYDETIDFIERRNHFLRERDSLSKDYLKISPTSFRHYQFDNSISVYLALRYPENYYIYKPSVFKEFIPAVDYSYTPKQGDIENVLQFNRLCSIINTEILADAELIKLHIKRLPNDAYMDVGAKMLTQDLIYCSTQYKPKVLKELTKTPNPCIITFENSEYEPQKTEVSLKGKLGINHIKRAIDSANVGNLGEELVLKWEQNKLEKLNSKMTAERVSKTKGDGLGYDIHSYDENDQPMYIEVKTTSGNDLSDFYITESELQRSINEKDNFVLYRLFNFDKKNNSANCKVYRGDLSALCINPTQYRVAVKKL